MTLEKNHNPYIYCADMNAFRRRQLKLLDELDRICKKHSLTYWLDFGTLLGAVRDGKFITWDDDLDISMPIEDYKKFLEIAPQELPNDTFLQTTESDPTYKESFAKLRDKNSTLLIDGRETGQHFGIFLDVMPSVRYPYLPKLLRKILMRYTVRGRYGAYAIYHYRWPNFVLYKFLRLIWFFIFLFPKKYYGQTPEDNGYMFIIPLEYLYPLSEINLEGKMYPAPHKVHEHLELMYKNHMTPLPPEKRVTHSKLIDPHTPYSVYMSKQMVD